MLEFTQTFPIYGNISNLLEHLNEVVPICSNSIIKIYRNVSNLILIWIKLL